MLYNLYKKAFNLNREQKEFLFNNLDIIIDGFKEQDRKLNAASRYTVLKTVVARGLHDPETPEEMLGLVTLLEKFIGIDNNISNDNISLFLKPMSSGSQKIMIRPCKVVGLIKKLDRLSRQFKLNKKNNDIDDNPARSEFQQHIDLIKERLMSPRKHQTEPKSKNSFPSSYNFRKRKRRL